MSTVKAFEAVASTSNTSTPKNETLIQFILDETGSMMSCKASTISSFNEFIQSQSKLDDTNKCLVSLNKFSQVGNWLGAVRSLNVETKSEPSIRPVFSNIDVNSVPELTNSTFTPTGMTNLYDAIGETIVSLDKTVKENQNILVVILTDGEENCSREYTSDSIKKLIDERQEKGWTFVYLGANQNAWKVGATMGLSKGQTLSYDTAEMSATMANLSVATSAYRMDRSMRSVSGTSRDFFDRKEGETK